MLRCHFRTACGEAAGRHCVAGLRARLLSSIPTHTQAQWAFAMPARSPLVLLGPCLILLLLACAAAGEDILIQASRLPLRRNS